MARPKDIAIRILVGTVVIAIVAAMVIPNLFAAKISWNDWAAGACMRNLVTVQEEFRGRALVDLDGDGKGEYGTFGELTGTIGVRADPEARERGAPVTPPIVSPAFSSVDDKGRASKSGYLFRILLPGEGGAPVREGASDSWTGGVCPRHGRCPGPPTRPPCATCVNPPPRVRHLGTPFSGPVDTDGAERVWCAYAWPVMDYGELKGEIRSHNRVFFTDATGDLWQTWNQDRRYFGDRSPSWDAAMPEDGWGCAWISPSRELEEYRGRDGNLWERCKRAH